MTLKNIPSYLLSITLAIISVQSAYAIPMSSKSNGSDSCNITFPSQQDLENEGVDFDPGIYSCKDLEQLQSNAQRKQLDALRILGIMHERGYLVEQNTEKAIKLLEEAANLGDKPSQHYLGESMLLVITKENADGTYDVDDSRQLYWKQKADSK
ncbi:tetratricopeptide repeat protein [Providencia stuartii]|uniref:tetratricopeptide repeat protein n=1 Tax=Providencia stuartii TaxID=588 RepID=UPI00370CE255